MQRRVRTVIVVLLAFCVGALCDGWLTVRLARKPVLQASAQAKGRRASRPTATRPDSRPLPPVADARPPARSAPAPLGTSGSVPAAGASAAAIVTLKNHRLRVPVDGADVSRWQGSFEEVHSGHQHDAVDILAPRGTPVHAADAGTIAKLFTSRDGGLTVYQFDPSRQFVYYYAHLDGYVPGLEEGQAVQAGDVIGYVGTTGNAPPNTPHLHFAISELSPGEGWWKGTPLDPYLVFR